MPVTVFTRTGLQMPRLGTGSESVVPVGTVVAYLPRARDRASLMFWVPSDLPTCHFTKRQGFPEAPWLSCDPPVLAQTVKPMSPLGWSHPSGEVGGWSLRRGQSQSFQVRRSF